MRHIMMKKIDAIIATGIGFITAIYFYNLLSQKGAIEKLEIFGDWLWLLLIVFPIMAAFSLWTASLIGRKFISIYQLAKFLLVGVMATIIDLGLLAIFIGALGITAGIGYNVFKGISFVLATSLKYIPDKLWAFKKPGSENVKKEFGQFLAITFVGLGINVFVADLIVNQIGPQFGLPADLWANLGGIGAVIAVFAWNFIGYKFIVFKK